MKGYIDKRSNEMKILLMALVVAGMVGTVSLAQWRTDLDDDCSNQATLVSDVAEANKFDDKKPTDSVDDTGSMRETEQALPCEGPSSIPCPLAPL